MFLTENPNFVEFETLKPVQTALAYSVYRQQQCTQTRLSTFILIIVMHDNRNLNRYLII